MYEYAAEVDLADIPAAPEGPPQAGAAGGRDLLVFGADTRTEITSTPAWPVSLNGRTAIGCTGTVISTTSVLTAGHCVYSSGAWRNADFTPAQYRTAANVDVSPYGKWAWSYIQTYTAWTASGDRNYDIAVVKMAPSAKGDIGTYMGYAGLRRSDSCSSYLNNSYNAGYPGDKSNPNNELWRSYCGAVFACVSSTALKTDHTCDTYGGNSGSSMMDASGWVHAVHVAHYLDGHGNIAVLLNGVHHDNVMKWSGRA
jgi:glutamyl endopeptidase